MFDVINSVVFHPPAPIYFTPTPPLVLCVAVLMFGDYFPASALPSNNTFRGLDQRGLYFFCLETEFFFLELVGNGNESTPPNR